jgi:2-phosphoglycerate kinase
MSSERVQVEDNGHQRPFMRGIMVHSLTARGLSFEEALGTANSVRDRLAGRGVVQRAELAKIVREVLGDSAVGMLQPPLPVPASIAVGTGSKSSPYSKGRLSQSLLAASLDPNDAFDVAREIELELLRRGEAAISRSALRELAYRTLLARFGPKTAERYLVWRKYQEPEKPVIILIGGTTGAGKTSVGLEVALRLGIGRVLSTDSIRQVMRMMLSRDLMPSIHASSFEAHELIPDAPGTEDPVLDGFVAQASVVSLGVRAMIDRAIEENASLVLDGVSLVPGLIDLSAYEDLAHIIFLVVARLDEDAFRSHFENRAEREGLRDAARYVKRLDSILKIQDHFLELADNHDVPIVDNTSIESSVMLVIRHVVEMLRDKEKVDVAELL